MFIHIDAPNLKPQKNAGNQHVKIQREGQSVLLHYIVWWNMICPIWNCFYFSDSLWGLFSLSLYVSMYIFYTTTVHSMMMLWNFHGEYCWCWLFIYVYMGYGSIPINTIFNGMNIHLPAILGFTRGTGFWPIPIWDMIWILYGHHL